MVLNTSQAQAVYSAMCALNNVGGRIKTEITQGRDDELRVLEMDDGSVSILYVETGRVADSERYTNQAAFAIAYGLN
jgi:hypothetical protein